MWLYTSGNFRFGPYTVDLRAHALIRDGVRVSIQEQPFQILLTLLESPGEVVSREDLRRRLWGDETFVDFNQSMNSAIRRLRTALQDDPKNPLYVETIPRVGFRLLAEVEFSATGAVSPEPTLAAPADRTSGFPMPIVAASKLGFGLRSAVVLSLATFLVLSFAAPKRLSPVTFLRRQAAVTHAAAFSNVAEAASSTADIATEPMGIECSTEPRALPIADRPRSSGDFAPNSNEVEQENLEGRYLVSQRNVESYERAIDAFQHALLLDAKSTPALVGLSQAHVLLSLDGRDAERHAAEAMEFARQALQLDPNLASAHAALGAAYAVKEWNWSAAGDELGKAIALDPNDSLAHLWFAMFVLVPEKHYAQAEEHTRQAIALDPLSLIALTDLGWIYYNEGQSGAALEQLRMVLRMNPNFVPARFRIAQLFEHEGRHQEAAQFEPSDVPLVARLRRISAMHRADPTTDPQGPCNDASAALSRHAGNSLPLLREAVEHHCVNFLYMDQEPRLAAVRQDPHFADLVHLLKLPEE